MTTVYVTSADVKAELSGDTPKMSGAWDGVLTDAIEAVTAEINREIASQRGQTDLELVAAATATARLFTGRVGPIRMLPIDDCVAVTSVVENGVTLVEGTDFVRFPLNAATTTALLKLVGTWSVTPASTVATCKWGLFASAPKDAWQQVIVEVIRAYEGARAGFNDVVGITPFGSAITSKSFTSKTWQMINTYGHGAGSLR